MDAKVSTARPDSGPPAAVVELASQVVARVEGATRPVAHERLKRSVHRLRFETLAGPASVVVKRLPPHFAKTSQLAAEQWLPAVGLEWACPRLRGVLEEPRGSAVWHVYEDIDGSGLDADLPDPDRVGPVVELIVELHARFAGHELLAQCRKDCRGLGAAFFTTELARCVGFLRSIASPGRRVTPEQAALRDRLLAAVERLHETRDERAELLETCGGSDTLLHGDLWTTNTLVAARPDGFQVRLVDWDQAGVGPVTYDISTFLFRFPSTHRHWILGRYREAAARRGLSLPDDSTLNLLFETAEYARYASCLAEAALAASEGKRWGFQRMEEIEDWFAQLELALAADGRR